MNRLLATMQLDVKLQIRNRIYAITLAMAVVIGIALRQFFQPADLQRIMPIFFLFAVGGTTYIIVAGLMIFEKGENTLDAQLISPIRLPEYLWSKVITLTFLVAIESSIIMLIATGFTGFNPILVYAGIILMGIMLTLGGIVQVVRHDAVTDFLIPALVITLALQLPFIHLLGVWENPLFYLIPTTAPTLLMMAGFGQTVEAWEMIYALGYSVLWLGILYVWATRAFQHHIVTGAGG